ncbi:hypothetical protein GF420_05255 [candidate division GN15 bacterium]|nr:hypothetical protein [candidate division GN15 bacterium]
MRYVTLAISLAIPALLLIVGCNTEPTSAPQSTTGTMTEQSIAPDVATILEERSDATWPGSELHSFNDWPDYLPSPFDTSYDIYAVTMIWGTLYNSATPTTEPVVWDGRLNSNFEGFVDVARGIQFEPGQDSIVPHDAPIFVQWVSSTLNDFDGVSCFVFFKRGIQYFAPPKVSFETAPFSVDIPVEELHDFTEFYRVDEHSGVIIHSHEIPHNACPGGLLGGRWVQETNDRTSGYFYGHWMDANGEPVGYLNGTFWKEPNANVGELEGSVSGLFTDEVIATLEGTWYFDDYRLCPLCGSSHGVFEATFATENSNLAGTIEGTFGDYSLPPDETDLPFSGSWQYDCSINQFVIDRSGANTTR